ncbi:Peptide chain release factor 1, partial [hydrothermal vent metagenome]
MTTITPQRIRQIEARFAELQAMMASGELDGDKFVETSKEYAEIEPVAAAAAAVQNLRDEQAGLEEMLAGDDAEMKAMAADEVDSVKKALEQAEHDLALQLLPKDSADDRPAMLEIRAGTGGDEAALFAGDLYRMYSRYAELQGWKVEMISANASEVG